jgi:metalloendopeptidase OMA1, mitochondrial
MGFLPDNPRENGSAQPLAFAPRTFGERLGGEHLASPSVKLRIVGVKATGFTRRGLSEAPGALHRLLTHFRNYRDGYYFDSREKNMQKRKGMMLVPLVIAGLVMLGQYFSSEKVTNPETGRSARVALSSQQEESLGLQSYREVLSQSRVIQSGPEYQLVTKVASRLAAVASKEFNWEVSVVDSEQANAFCLPGGKIVVYTGILPYTRSEAGLAAVMGHEMAHAVARHGSQRLLRSSLAQTLMMGASASLSMSDMDWNERRGVLAALGAGAQFGVILPFSREHETEADQMGILYMARAGYDPREALKFWERMAEANSQQPPEFASTHPSHTTRIRDLESFMPRALAEYENASKR